MKLILLKSFNDNGEEYFDVVKDSEVLKVITPLLIPNIDELLKKPKEALKELIKY